MAKKKPAEKLTPIPKHAPRARRSPADKAPGAQPATAPDLSHIAEQLRPLAVPIGDLDFLPDNALEHDDEEVSQMQEELRTNGQVLPLIVNRRRQPAVVVGGNKRLRAALAENWQWIAVVNVDLGDEEEAAWAVKLNATQGQKWDKALLHKALHRIGKLSLGQHTEKLLSRLAEAKKLIPADPKPGADGQAGDPPAKRTVKCPSCQHEFEP